MADPAGSSMEPLSRSQQPDTTRAEIQNAGTGTPRNALKKREDSNANSGKPPLDRIPCRRPTVAALREHARHHKEHIHQI